ncbi:Amt family ammonium transporter [Natronocella acetinitrilica]|uniref:Ammonium transporter n=1 Tax=Natronocella acetinitrilica TaxID=414046 RepID=A0AAE3KDE8_9GAMM|nr:ammonium transporter [Natronocella acetinitrilica]MCP1676789.1 Amt family ammonium transporter [Natronocella acetinitrilica]
MDQAIEIAYALDTFYFLISGALVMWMAAGFTMLESGLVRSKNTTEILTKNISLYSVACIMYLFFGYQVMYGGGPNGVIPGLSFGLDLDNSVSEVLGSDGDIYYSNTSDFFFQVVFVATAMSIVSGAVAERMKLWSFLVFAIVLTGVIYPVQGYWSWGEGWLDALGYSDYAGSGIVHMAGAAAALAGVILLGPRKGKYGKDGEVRAIPGANLPLATLGTFILWLGWFGFNGGSELKVSDVESANAVALVFTNTNLAAAAGLIAAMILSKAMFGKADLTFILNGALAGLVSITAGPDVPSQLMAVIIGAIGGVIVVFSIIGLDKLKIDDPVGAISVHGTCGIWGVMAVLLWNSDASFFVQIIGLGAIFGWVFITSFIVWAILKSAMGIRVSEEEEVEGLDILECGMEAYPEFDGKASK